MSTSSPSLFKSNLSMSIAIDSKGEEDHSAPSSPTDNMLSPCSMKILGRGRKIKSKLIQTSRMGATVIKEYYEGAAIRPVTNLPIILGSSSSSRRSILVRNGWIFELANPDIDEKSIRDDNPYDLPIKIATAKADALLARLNSIDERIIITADQIVLFKGEIREKPQSEAEAKQFLTSYSNQKVSTVSAIVVTHIPSGRQAAEVDIASIVWGTIPDEVVNAVVQRGEVYGSAGGFRIEDPDLQPYIIRIDGSVDSILGLPVEITNRCIAAVSTDSYFSDDENKGV